MSLVQQCQRHVGIEFDEAFRIGDDLGLEDSIHVGLVQRRADHVIEVVVTQYRGELTPVEQLDQLTVHARFRQREERIEENPPALAQIDDDPAVKLALNG